VRHRWRVLALTIAVLCLLNGFAAAQILPLPLPIISTAAIDPTLQQILQTASLGQIVEAVLTFDHVPTATDLLVVTATAFRGCGLSTTTASSCTSSTKAFRRSLARIGCGANSASPERVSPWP